MRPEPLAVIVTVTLALGAATSRFASAGKPKAPPTPRPLTTVEAVKVPLKAPVRSLAELETALTSLEASARAGAAWELAGAGVVPETIANRLMEALTDDPDAGVRTAAVWALAHVRRGVATAAAPTDDKLQQTPLDEPARLVQTSKLAYPEEPFAKGIQGTVVVELVVDEDGKVAHAEVRGSVPPLDAAALAAVRGWRFTPATLAGKPIASVASAPVAFTIRTGD
jgi:protein TonB